MIDRLWKYPPKYSWPYYVLPLMRLLRINLAISHLPSPTQSHLKYHVNYSVGVQYEYQF